MLLMQLQPSVAGMFALLNVVVTAGNLPFYFVCALAVLLGAHRFAGMSPAACPARQGGGARVRSCIAHGRPIGIGAKPLLWALALLGRWAFIVYWAGPSSAPATQVRSQLGYSMRTAQAFVVCRSVAAPLTRARRQAPGLSPANLRNSLLKWAWSARPQSAAI